MSFKQPDNFSVVTKLARAGFPGLTLDTDVMFEKKLQALAEERVIPAYNRSAK